MTACHSPTSHLPPQTDLMKPHRVGRGVDLTPLEATIKRHWVPRKLDFEQLEANEASTIGLNLRRCRLALQAHQYEIATLLNVSRTQYRNYEDGRHQLRLLTTAQYMMRTGIPLHYLLAGSCYEYLFSHLTLRREFLPLQSYVGRCSEGAFNGLAALLCHQLELDQAAPPKLELRWPDDAQIDAELDAYYQIIGEGLYQLRQIVGIGQEELAELLGITYSTLSAYERNRLQGARQFGTHMAMRLWAATGINPLWITCGSHFYARRWLQHLRMEYLHGLFSRHPDSLLYQVQQVVQQLPGVAWPGEIQGHG